MTDPLASPLIDRESVLESKDLMGEKFGMLVGYFLEDSAMYVGQIEQAFARGEVGDLVPPSHTLKSSARQMGAERLSSMAEGIEHGAREAIKLGSGVAGLKSLVDALKNVLSQTLTAFREFT